MPRSRRSDRFCKTSRRPTLCWYDASAHAWHVSNAALRLPRLNFVSRRRTSDKFFEYGIIAKR